MGNKMDSIKFIKPSTSLWKPKEETKSTENEWEKHRRPTDMAKPALSVESIEWLTSLPEEQRPVLLPKRFPHIVNMIAYHWKNPFNCNRYLDQLTIRQREDRQGFPPEVFKELIQITFMSKKRG